MTYYQRWRRLKRALHCCTLPSSWKSFLWLNSNREKRPRSVSVYPLGVLPAFFLNNVHKKNSLSTKNLLKHSYAESTMLKCVHQNLLEIPHFFSWPAFVDRYNEYFLRTKEYCGWNFNNRMWYICFTWGRHDFSIT